MWTNYWFILKISGNIAVSRKNKFRFLDENAMKCGNNLLVHFENFSANSQHYILPDQLKTGVPVFHYPEYSMSNTPELYIPDLANIPSFLSYWKPISSLGK